MFQFLKNDGNLYLWTSFEKKTLTLDKKLLYQTRATDFPKIYGYFRTWNPENYFRLYECLQDLTQSSYFIQLLLIIFKFFDMVLKLVKIDRSNNCFLKIILIALTMPHCKLFENLSLDSQNRLTKNLSLRYYILGQFSTNWF